MRGIVEKLSLPTSRSPSPPTSPTLTSPTALLPARRKIRLVLGALLGCLLLFIQLFGLKRLIPGYRHRHPLFRPLSDNAPTSPIPLNRYAQSSTSVSACAGPDGLPVKSMESYSEVWSGHPSAPIGSYGLVGLPEYCTSYSQRYSSALSLGPKVSNGSWARAVDGCISMSEPEYQGPLQAIVLRSYDWFHWHQDDILHTRALINELVLRTGGRYRLHILVEVKSDEAVYSSEEARQRVLDKVVPAEFREFADLWTENMMTAYWPGLGPPRSGHSMTGHYRGCYLPLVNFALLHPEYEYIWNWEMDVRYTGDYLDLFSSAEKFAAGELRQPKMEAYKKWYIPSIRKWKTHDDDLDRFTPLSNLQEDNSYSYSHRNRDSNINSDSQEKEDKLDMNLDLRNNQGEEADYISFMPIFDPRGSGWYWADDVHGFVNGTKQSRRASINTCNRVSRKLLLSMNKMHSENRQILFCEAMGPTAALLYNHKAVYVPHPVYMDNDWSPEKIDDRLNDKRFYSKKGEKNARRSTYYYDAKHSFEIYNTWRDMDKEGVKTCRKPALLHPVKSHWFSDQD